MQEPMTDPVNHPPHYNAHPSGVECIDIVRHMNFNLGNVVKYLWRAGLKHEHTLEDLQKALFYLNDEISRVTQARISAALKALTAKPEVCEPPYTLKPEAAPFMSMFVPNPNNNEPMFYPEPSKGHNAQPRQTATPAPRSRRARHQPVAGANGRRRVRRDGRRNRP